MHQNEINGKGFDLFHILYENLGTAVYMYVTKTSGGKASSSKNPPRDYRYF